MAEAAQTYVLEPVELDDADDLKLTYEEVPKFADDDPDNFEALFTALQGGLSVEDAETKLAAPQTVESGYKPSNASTTTSASSKDTLQPSPEDMCVEDFVRNFLVAHKMEKTLEAFQIEWFELNQGKPNSSTASKDKLPRIYQQYQELLQEMDILKRTAAAAAAAAAEAKGTWAKFRHERDVHRLHHRRLVQEKNSLVTDLKRLRRHVRQFQPALDELQKKYEQATKELVLVRLEKSKLQQALAALQAQYQHATGESAQTQQSQTTTGQSSLASVAASLRGYNRTARADRTQSPGVRSRTRSPSPSRSQDAAPVSYTHLLPIETRNESSSKVSKNISLTSAVMAHSFAGHKMGISGVAVSPTSPIFATTSDDMTWKLWSLPRGELIMTGKGGNSWFAGGAFHPSGSLFATAGADGKAKIWNLAEQRCVSQLLGHTQPVWDIQFHEGQHTALTASGDNTARLWDIHTSQLLRVFRGHVDAINRVRWIPHTATFLTASGDKTVSLWDARTGLCVQSFFGHAGAVRALDVSPSANAFVSGDARGMIKLWDLSTGAEVMTYDQGSTTALGSTTGIDIELGVNSLTFDPTGKSFVAAIDSGKVRVFQRENPEVETQRHGAYDLAGEMQVHSAESIVQDLVITKNGDFAIAGGNDGQVMIWQL